MSIKQGQVAHLDRNRANHKKDNLAFMCLPHHDSYDTRPSQSKRLTMAEAKQFRGELHATLRRLDEDSVTALESIKRGPSGADVQGGDHWVQRSQLELHVIANVASGRPPTALPISKEPEISRLRFLKDEIGNKRLNARTQDSQPNINTQIAIDEFVRFAQRVGQRQWVVEFADRWKAQHGEHEHTYLSDKDTELTHAVLLMVLRSAWGRWYRRQVGVGDDKVFTDPSTLHVAAHLICDAAMNGKLQIRGREASEIGYEPIASEAWRLAALSVVPDPASIWKVEVQPRYGVAPQRLARIMSYDSLVVDSQAFQALWPGEARKE